MFTSLWANNATLWILTDGSALRHDRLLTKADALRWLTLGLALAVAFFDSAIPIALGVALLGDIGGRECVIRELIHHLCILGKKPIWLLLK